MTTKPSPPSTDKPTPTEEEIPILTSITPAMYVPMPPDFLTAFEPPTSTTSHLEASLATMDAHAAAVKANILALAKRECIRFAREVARTHDQSRFAPEPRTGMHPAEVKSMIANMEAPKESALGCLQLPSVPDFDTWPVNSPVEWREMKMMAIVSKTMAELSGYERHVALVRRTYEEALERARRADKGDDAMDVDMEGGHADGLSL